MKRILSTTAIVLTLGTSAYADAHGGATMDFTFDEAANLYASNLIGMRLYASEAEMDENQPMQAGAEQEWDDVGEINDVILTREGEVAAVIAGVGGFLGIGEKDVALNMDQIKFMREEGETDDFFLVINANADMLKEANAFERAEMEAEEAEAAAEATAANAAAETEEAAEETEMAAENAAEEVEETAENAAAETEQAAENAEAEVEQTAENAEAEVEQAAENAEAEAEQTAENAETELANEANEDGMTDTPGMFTRPEIERDGYMMAEMQDLTAEKLTGANVYGINDKDLGEVSTIIVKDDGTIGDLILDIGGFLGLGEKQIAVAYDELNIQRSEDGSDVRVYIDATEEELESRPEYEG